MGKHNNTGLHQLRNAFPKSEGWDVRGIGNHAAEVWNDVEYIGLISYDKTTGKWASTHNMTLSDGDDRFQFDTPKAAALDYYCRFSTFAQSRIVDFLKGG